MHQTKCLISVPNVCLGHCGPPPLTCGGMTVRRCWHFQQILMLTLMSLVEASSISVFHPLQECGHGEQRFVLSQEVLILRWSLPMFNPKSAGQVPNPSDEGWESSFRNQSKRGSQYWETACQGITEILGCPRWPLWSHASTAFRKPCKHAFWTHWPGVIFTQGKRGQGHQGICSKQIAPSEEPKAASFHDFWRAGIGSLFLPFMLHVH